MRDPITIPADEVLKPSQDYQSMMDEAIRLVQTLSGNIWTDYNRHDPGVTMLYQLCYALSEVGYRSEVDLERLLYYGKHLKEERKEVNANNAFFNPQDIYPNSALTLNDYRVLIIDQIDEVADAWVRPQRNNVYGYQGLYEVILKLHLQDDDTPQEEEGYEERTKKKVEKLLSANRNLCEDIASIEILKGEPVTFTAKIELRTDTIEEEVLAAIFQRVQDYFSPPTKYYNIEQRQAAGLTNKDIYNVPSFVHGFIQQDELSEYGRIYYVSKMAELISTVPGVWGLEDFEVYLGAVDLEKGSKNRVRDDKLDLPPGCYPYLDTKAFFDNEVYFKIELSKAGIKTVFGVSAIEYYLEANRNRQHLLKHDSDRHNKPRAPKTEEEDIKTFESIQNTFPPLFGVGKYGRRGVLWDYKPRLEAKEGLSRYQRSDSVSEGHVKQLQGFLYFFDQFLTNHLEQLSSVRDVFSVAQTKEVKSYYARLFKSVDTEKLSELEALTNAKGALKENANDTLGYETLLKPEIVAKLDELGRVGSIDFDRVNRALSHLLARFGDYFPLDRFGTLKEFLSGEEEVVVAKKAYLNQMPRFSRNRSQGMDYLSPSFLHAEEGKKNIPMFKERIALLLGLGEAKDDSLICGKAKKESFRVKALEAREEKTHNEILDAQGKLHFPIIIDKSKEGDVEVGKVDPLPYLFKYATVRKNYEVREEEGKYLLVYKPFKKEKGFKILEGDTEKEVEDRLELDVIAQLKKLERASESFHVVEHLLLRPLASDQTKFSILDGGGKELFKSITVGSASEQIAIAKDVIGVGTQRENYEIEPLGKEKFAVYLKLDGKKVARAIANFLSLAQAEDRITHIFIPNFVAYEKGLDPFTAIRTSMEDSHVKDPDPDLVNFKLSLVLPNWVSKFQNKDFQKLIELLLHENLPVWCQAELKFLTNKEMIAFETLWANWLEARQRNEDLVDIDQKAEEINLFLHLITENE